MKRCKDLVRRLSEYIDGELDDSFCAHLEAHLDDCAPCRAFIRNLRRTVRCFERIGRLRAPADARARLRRRLAETR